MAPGKRRKNESAGTARTNRRRGTAPPTVRLLRAGSGEANPELDRARQRARKQQAAPIQRSTAARGPIRKRDGDE